MVTENLASLETKEEPGLRRACSCSDTMSLVQLRIGTRTQPRPLELMGLSYLVKNDCMSLPPQEELHAGPQTGQSIVQVCEDVDQSIQHPDKEGCRVGWGDKGK